ncbi:PhoH family protein [Coxiella-like endosymbiont]|uniref:PhoH family protein n=1 Tax=Coxiella-like endosymbiont TaxID=1592897 RepID=UPI003F6F3D2F
MPCRSTILIWDWSLRHWENISSCVACAIADLAKEEVSRIVLTCPSVEAEEKLGYLTGDLTQKLILTYVF